MAAQTLLPGQTVIQENPILFVLGDNEDNISIGMSCVPFLRRAFDKFLALSPAAQTDVLDFYNQSLTIEPYFRRFGEFLGLDAGDLEAFTKVISILKLHAVWANPAPALDHIGLGLYPVACRIGHSCQPNCIWFSGRCICLLLDSAGKNMMSRRQD